MTAETGTPPTDAKAPQPFTPAWRSPKAWCVLVVVVLCGLGFDLGTKTWSFLSLIHI